jgi:hypothetical protein
MRVMAIKIEVVWISKSSSSGMMTDGIKGLRGQISQRWPQDFVHGKIRAGEIRNRDEIFVIFTY